MTVLVAIIHVIFKQIGLVTEAAVGSWAKRIVAAHIVGIGSTGIGCRSAVDRRGRIVGRCVANTISVCLAIRVCAATFEGVVKTEIMSGFVDVDF